MTVGPAPRARKPSQDPSRSDLDERDRYAKLTAASVDTVLGSAQAWRNGLTAFITLVTTAVIFQGRDTTSGLATGWRTAVTIPIGGGLLLAVLGLWQALAAEAGTDPNCRPFRKTASSTAPWPSTKSTWPPPQLVGSNGAGAQSPTPSPRS